MQGDSAAAWECVANVPWASDVVAGFHAGTAKLWLRCGSSPIELGADNRRRGSLLLAGKGDLELYYFEPMGSPHLAVGPAVPAYNERRGSAA